jgi:predicted  nucleic acid-binding Zn-ribbon protein
LNEDIAQLVTLQTIDLEIDKIDSAVKSEQNRLDDRISALAVREATINELLEKITAHEKENRTLEDEVADKMSHVRERQSKMMQVQTGREQTALLKEIEDAKKNAKENEEKMILLMEDIEKLRSQSEEEQNLLKGEKKLVSEETENVRSNIEKINKGKKAKDAERNRQAKKVKENTLRKYNTLRERRNGLAVVNVVAGVCQGCFMAIPPQRFNMLLRGDMMFDCPTCQRIMYYAPPEEKN